MAKQEQTETGESHAPALPASRTFDWPASLLAVLLLIGFLLGLIYAYEEVAQGLAESRLWLSESVRFLYLGGVTAALALCLWLAFGRGAKIRLGADDERPDFTFFPWLAMMVGAGMALGLVIWGVAEPLHHLMQNPRSVGEQESSLAAIQPALRFTMLHWGFHPWAVYCVAAAAFGYAGHRARRRNGAGSMIGALTGTGRGRTVLRLVDGLALTVALFVVIAALALAAGQIDESVAILFRFDSSASQAATAADLAREAARSEGITDPAAIQAMIESRRPLSWHPLVVLAAVLVSTVGVLALGLHRGIRELAAAVGVLALAFAGFILLFGPTSFVLDGLGQAAGDYLATFISAGLWADLTGETSEWQHWWTLFYWAWWLALAIPVGLFIALISRGRTMRQLVGGCLLAAGATSLTWVGIAGTASLHAELLGEGGLTAAVRNNAAHAVHALFESMEFALFDWALPALAPAGPLLFSLTLAGAGILFLAAGVVAVDRLSARNLAPGLLARRLVWSVVITGAAAALWLIGGESAVHLLRSAVFVCGSFALPLLAAAGWSLTRDLIRERSDSR